MSEAHDKVPARIVANDRVPVGQKLAYAAGGAVDWFTGGLLMMFWMPVFNLGMHINPAVLSVILTVYRLWDAITDPVMGNISDNTRTRWGRRRPYILVGAVLAAVITPFVWRANPAWGNPALYAYITAMGMLLFTATTVWAMPYNSLMLEMTPNYDERTRIAAYRTIFTKFGILISGWLLPLATSSFFANPATGAPDIVRGVQTISIGLAVLTILVGSLPALFVPERYYFREAATQTKEPFFKGLRETMHLKPLWWMIGIVVFQTFGTGMTGALGFYINIYVINDGKLADASVIEGFKNTTGFLVGLAAVPFWTWVCERLDKKWTLMIIIASGFIGAVLNLLCLTPEHPLLQIVPAVFYASVTASLWLILPSMMADVVDFDELHTRRRREGSINAVFSWFMKLGFSASAMLSGFVLNWTGFDVKVGADQPEQVLHRMLAFYILLPIGFWVTALILLWTYPLNRRRMAGIRAELEARRGTV